MERKSITFGRYGSMFHAGVYLGGLSAEAVRSLLRRGAMPYIKVGKMVFLDRYELDHYLAKKGPLGAALTAIHRAPDGDSRVYFVKSGDDVVKIGISKNIERRLESLQSGSHVRLEVIASICGDWKTERDLHAAFSDLKIRGEWFHFGDKIRKFIASPYFKHAAAADSSSNGQCGPS